MSSFVDDPGSFDTTPALGTVVEQGRGSLPFSLLHGESLVACASWSLGAAEVTAVDLGTQWEAIVESELPFVVHDSLCPLTPPAFLASCVALALAEDEVVVGVRPVTDTVKAVREGSVGATVDRSTLVQVCSPVVLPPAVVAALDDLPDVENNDLAGLVAALAERFVVVSVEAPPEGRRVGSADDVRLLEAFGTGEAGPVRPE